MKREANNKKRTATVIARDAKQSQKYDPSVIEHYWQSVWEDKKLYQPDLATAKKPYYNLHMFPYPSAEGLHVGNVYAFTGADIHGRFKRQQGYSVFQPFGLDGFGIHSENYALKVGSHPMEQAAISETRFYNQVRSLGSGYDWSHTLETYDPDYYRWTQWIFIQLFKAGLAYRAKVPVNFCPSCKTVLADEQVIDGQCERCGSVVEKRDLEQWMFRITEYAEQLLEGLDRIDWTERVKIAQKNWIGKSEGAKIEFRIQNSEFRIGVFTTRPDTLYGATFLVVSPEHPIVTSFLNLELKIKNVKLQEIGDYVDQAKQKSEIERVGEKSKTGVFTGAYAINPINNQQIPIWIADYVLMSYGTGAIMAVPAHDQRDFEFARKYELPIVQVVKPSGVQPLTGQQNGEGLNPYSGPGILINSGDWNDLVVPDNKTKVIADLQAKGIGEGTTNYHLRDWLISRQRYWGPPIPMIFCQTCADKGESWFTSSEHSEYSASQKIRKSDAQKIRGAESSEFFEMAGWYPAENLPVELPFIQDYKPLGTHSEGSGQAASPLSNHPEFYETTCPACGSQAQRETDVSDTFLDSAWYFYRYLATDFKNISFPMAEQAVRALIASEERAKQSHQKDLPAGKAGIATLRQAQGKLPRNDEGIRNLELEISNSVQRTAWLPPTIYTGGAEHSVLHLLYARFMTKVFKDLGLLDFSAKGRPASGWDEPFPRFFAHGLIIKDGAKMSKSKGNVVVPDTYIKKFGADTLRSYLMFLGPFNQGGDFRDSGIEGMSRFIKRVWTLISGVQPLTGQRNGEELHPLSLSAQSELHKAIKGVTEDIEAFHYNTALAKIMTYYNFLSKQESVSREEAKVLLQLLAPFAPHMTEELWQRIHNSESRIQNGEFKSIHTTTWPQFDEAAIDSGELIIAVQVNGKLRATFLLTNPNASQAEVERVAQEDLGVQRHLEGKTIHKVIYVPHKIINFVVS